MKDMRSLVCEDIEPMTVIPNFETPGGWRRWFNGFKMMEETETAVQAP